MSKQLEDKTITNRNRRARAMFTQVNKSADGTKTGTELITYTTDEVGEKDIQVSKTDAQIIEDGALTESELMELVALKTKLADFYNNPIHFPNYVAPEEVESADV